MTCPFCQHQEHLPGTCPVILEELQVDSAHNAQHVTIRCNCHPTAVEIQDKILEAQVQLFRMRRAHQAVIEAPAAQAAQDPHHSPPGSNTGAAGR